jgi:hypothetical protein
LTATVDCFELGSRRFWEYFEIVIFTTPLHL